ncbi:MAG: hypothetical protein ACMXYF_00645 [Candidatus Woesearchaeota archaeon]
MKAQSELLGFVIVVLLMSVGMLFVLGFYVFSEPSQDREIFSDRQISTMLNAAILQTSTTCYSLPLRDLVVDSQRPTQSINCPNSDGVSTPSLEYAKTKIEQLLNATLDVWDVDYEYRAYRVQGDEEQGNPIELNRGACRGKEQVPNTLLLPIPPSGTVYSVLTVC